MANGGLKLLVAFLSSHKWEYDENPWRYFQCGIDWKNRAGYFFTDNKSPPTWTRGYEVDYGDLER